MTFGRGDGAATLEAVRRMVDAQAHRGPDGSGARLVSASDPAVALGHRRLAIIDLSERGAQPMADATDTLHAALGECRWSSALARGAALSDNDAVIFARDAVNRAINAAGHDQPNHRLPTGQIVQRDVIRLMTRNRVDHVA